MFTLPPGESVCLGSRHFVSTCGVYGLWCQKQHEITNVLGILQYLIYIDISYKIDMIKLSFHIVGGSPLNHQIMLHSQTSNILHSTVQTVSHTVNLRWKNSESGQCAAFGGTQRY